MNVDEHIAKLEALLARVRSRSRAPVERRAPAAPRPPLHASPLELPTPAGAFHPSPLPPPPAQPIPPTRPKYASRPEFPAALFAPRSTPPPSNAPVEGSLDSTLNEITVSPPRSPVRPEPSFVRAAHAAEPPPMEVIELEVDPDPSEGPPPVSSSAFPSEGGRLVLRGEMQDEPSGALPVEEPLESRSRLVSAPPVPPDHAEAEEPSGHVASDPTIEVAAAEVSRAELEALEAEHAPSSSRRPISMEEKMNELDDDIVPLHTPPPESGRLPTASPAIELSFETKKAQPEALPVGREVTRAQPSETADVALFVGQAPEARAPKTFGDLLEDALSL